MVSNTAVAFSSIDHGQPPESVRQQAERTESLVLGRTSTSPRSVADPALAGSAPEAVSQDVSTLNPDVPSSSPASPKLVHTQSERVELDYVSERPEIPSFQLAFTVGEVCIRENYISMLIISDLGFKPSTTMRFTLKYRGKMLPVIFAGAEFEFQTVGVRGISFLIDRSRKDKPSGPTVK